MYQQELGRFMSRDPLLEGAVELLHPVPDMRQSSAEGTYKHAYAYVRNNPINAVDPTGLVTVEFLKISPYSNECKAAEKTKAKEAVENACKKAKTVPCLPRELRECFEGLCKDDNKIVVACVLVCDGPDNYCGSAWAVEKVKKEWMERKLNFVDLCESAVPDKAVPGMLLCWTNVHGAGLKDPSKCPSNPPSAEVIAFHEMLHLCGTGLHGANDITWDCQKSCYPKSTKGKKEKCKCPSC